MKSAVIASLLGSVLAWGCGGSAADDIARGIDDAIGAAEPRPLTPLPKTRPVTEEDTEAAARRAVCNALEAYSSDPSQSLTEYIRDYAERQRVLAQFSLNEIDPDEADRLAAAASDINDSQQAAEVADELRCS